MFESLLSRLQYLFYVIVWFVVALPLLLLVFWRYRSYNKHKKRLLERLACYGNKRINTKLWIHLASVGEAKAALPFLAELLKQYSLADLMFTTTTTTGEEVLRTSLGGAINHRYLPFDIPWLMRKFIRQVQPDCVLVFETELWPAMLLECENLGVNALLINARLSNQSLKKYLRFTSLSKKLFGSLAMIVAQTREDADNFKTLGAKNIMVSGNIKLDITLDDALKAKVTQLRDDWSATKDHKIIIAASTHNTEEKLILDAFLTLQKQYKNVRLLIAPRHPQRFEETKVLCCKCCENNGLATASWTDSKGLPLTANIMVVDTLGELPLFFGLCDIAIMGGTFIEHGGHNFLEPAAWGVPIVGGKSDYNFKAIAAGLVAAGALTQVNTADELTSVVGELLLDDDKRCEQGKAAKNYIKNNRGALEKLMQAIQPYIR